VNEDVVREYVRSLGVPIYDVGPGGTLKFGSALRLVQETSEQHLAVMHAGYETMRSTAGLVFFIISTRVKIVRMPRHGERIVIKTHPRGRAGAQFYRDFLFCTEAGESLLEVMQTTVLADAETRKIRRPQALKQFGFYPENLVEPEKRMKRISVPDDLPQLGERRVSASDLDANGHMNNAVYGDIVWDFLPPEMRRSVRLIQINYLSEAGEGDVLRLSGGRSGAGFLLRGDHEGGASFTASAESSEGAEASKLFCKGLDSTAFR
jgi:medium-chain acyl-[acyl-carrier-protein] hydrolase